MGYEYRLIQSPKEYAACRSLAKAHGENGSKLGFPTVGVWSGTRLKGFVSTHKRKDTVICGPLVIDTPVSPRVMFNLVSCYEKLLLCAGVRHYQFHISKLKAKWIQAVEDWGANYGGLEKIAEADESVWFMRNI